MGGYGQPVVMDQGGVFMIANPNPPPLPQVEEEVERDDEVDYADQFHGPWEIQITAVEAK